MKWTGRLGRAVRMLCLVLVAALLVSSCGVTRHDGEDASNRRLRMMIPNSPGGGYDLTGRSAARAMQENDLTGRFEVTNVIGAGGTVAMMRLMNEEGNDDLLMMMGLGVVGSTYTNGAQVSVSSATPIARLVEEYEGILVPSDSPFQSVNDFVAAWRADPGSLSIGGGSSPGGPDHLFPMELAQAVGIEPSQVNYIKYDGGGPLTTALLGGKISAGMSGLGEFEGQIADGSLRVLAVSGPERIDSVDAPTLTESGIEMTFINWRGVLAPPGIDEETEGYFIELLAEMRKSEEWKEALARNGWTDSFLPGEEFKVFLEEQDERVASTLKELGLA